MKNLILLACLALPLLVTGCFTTGTAEPPPKKEYSSMPHNLPQRWEGQSRMGGMLDQY